MHVNVLCMMEDEDFKSSEVLYKVWTKDMMNNHLYSLQYKSSVGCFLCGHCTIMMLLLLLLSSSSPPSIRVHAFHTTGGSLPLYYTRIRMRGYVLPTTSISTLSQKSKFDRLSNSKLIRLTNELCANKDWDEENIRDAQKIFAVWSKRSKSMSLPSNRKRGRSLTSHNCFEIGMHHILCVLAKFDPDLPEGWYLAAIDASGRCDDAFRSEQILEEIIAQQRCPSIKLYNAVIDAWSKSSDENAPKRAELILNTLLKSNSSITPNTITFNNVINAWSKYRNKTGYLQCGEQAERVFRTMKDMYASSGNYDYQPSQVTYNILMNAWANTMRSDSIFHVNRIFEEMKDNGVSPDNFSYSSLLMALANSNVDDIVNKADTIIGQIEDLDSNNRSDVKLDGVMLNIILHVWLRCDKVGISDKRALDIISRMESSSDKSLRPNTVSYNILMNIYANIDNNGKRAESILKRMESTNDVCVTPDVISYNTVLKSWAKSGNAKRAEEILEDMEKNLYGKKTEIIPDQISFHTVIDAWTYSQEDNAAGNAEQLLERMDKLFQQGFKQLKPTSQTYNMVLNAWSKSKAPEAVSRAQKILQYMEQSYEEGNRGIKPDVVAYTTVMNIIAKSKEKNKSRIAQGILSRMNTLYNNGDVSLRPNVISYGTALNACAYTFAKEDKEEALAIAEELLQEMKSKPWLNPNHVIYATVLKVIGKCIPRRDHRRELRARLLFRECCLNGQVSSLVLENLRSTVSIEIYNYLLGREHDDFHSVTTKDLPHSWTCNAAKRHSRSAKMSAFRKTRSSIKNLNNQIMQ